MKLFIISMILALIAGTMAFPTIDANEAEDRAPRQRRVTCDLLGFMGDSACAAHCLTMGKAGGTCSGGVCICRSDTLTEVLENRFGPLDQEWVNRFTTTLSPLDPATWLNRRRNKN